MNHEYSTEDFLRNPEKITPAVRHAIARGEEHLRIRGNHDDRKGEGMTNQHQGSKNGHHHEDDRGTETKKERAMTEAEVRAHIENSGVDWVTAHDMVKHLWRLVCVDGRNPMAGFGTPGGSMGEVLLGLATAEAELGHEYTDDEIRKMFYDFINEFGGMYMHTDHHALHKICEALRPDPDFARWLPDPESSYEHQMRVMERLIENPPPHLQEKLLDILVNPEYFGCGDLKLRMLFDIYKVDKHSFEVFMREFYKALWMHVGGVVLDFLPDDHDEGAVVNFVIDTENCGMHNRFPLFRPNNGKERGKVFINHPQLVTLMRGLIAKFFCREGHFTQAQFEEGRDKLAPVYLATTVGKLATSQGVPMYTATFKEGQSDFTLKKND